VPRPEVEGAIDSRARILDAALRLFAEKGYAATAVHEITDAARVNRALLYYYFEDKHSLYVALIDEGVAEFHRMLDSALSGPGTYADRLTAFVREHLELIWSKGDRGRMVHRCLLDGQQQEFGLVEKFHTAVERLEAFFEEAAAAGEFRKVNPQIAARALLGPTFVFSLWRISEGERFSRDEIAAQITEQLLLGLRLG
jgi:AcrR family transcriptional regulator